MYFISYKYCTMKKQNFRIILNRKIDTDNYQNYISKIAATVSWRAPIALDKYQSVVDLDIIPF